MSPTAPTAAAIDPTLAVVTPALDPAAPPPALLPYQQAWLADEAQLKVDGEGPPHRRLLGRGGRRQC
jgi:hypothetical protein